MEWVQSLKRANMQSACTAFRVLNDLHDVGKGGEIIEVSAKIHVQ